MPSLWQCVGQCLEFWCVDASFSPVEVSCVSCEKVWCTSPWMCVCVCLLLLGVGHLSGMCWGWGISVGCAGLIKQVDLCPDCPVYLTIYVLTVHLGWLVWGRHFTSKRLTVALAHMHLNTSAVNWVDEGHENRGCALSRD